MLSKNTYTNYYLALKRKGIQTPAATWTDLKDTVPSEISQSQKTNTVAPYAWDPYNGQIHRDKGQEGGCQGSGKENGEFVVNGDSVSILQDGESSVSVWWWCLHSEKYSRW